MAAFFWPFQVEGYELGLPRYGMIFRNPCSPHWQRGSHQHLAPRQRKNTPKTEMPTIPSWAAWMGNHRQGANRIPVVFWCKPRGAAVAFEVSKGPAILQPRSSLSRPGSRWSGYTLFYWIPVVLFWYQKSHPFEELQKCVYSCFFPFFDPGFLSNILTPQLQQAEALRHSEAFRVA